MLEEFATLLAELGHGFDGWFRPRGAPLRGDLLKSRSAIVLSAGNGERGRFLTTLPAEAVVRVERVSKTDSPMCWIVPVDDAARRALIPPRLRHSISTYTLELPYSDRGEHFDIVMKPRDRGGR